VIPREARARICARHASAEERASAANRCCRVSPVAKDQRRDLLHHTPSIAPLSSASRDRSSSRERQDRSALPTLAPGSAAPRASQRSRSVVRLAKREGACSRAVALGDGDDQLPLRGCRAEARSVDSRETMLRDRGFRKRSVERPGPRRGRYVALEVRSGSRTSGHSAASCRAAPRGGTRWREASRGRERSRATPAPAREPAREEKETRKGTELVDQRTPPAAEPPPRPRCGERR
jgi:hypothetical protein